jgi:hypothetical protein
MEREPSAGSTDAAPLDLSVCHHVGGLVVIGWKERLEFTEWGLRRIRVKIDTGALTSALDVARYEWGETADGGRRVTMYFALDRRHPERLTCVQAPVLKTVVVRNTAGTREERPLIETAVRLGPVHKRIRLTIADRSSMRYRMILGREALAGSFVVDVSRTYLLRSRPGG